MRHRSATIDATLSVGRRAPPSPSGRIGHPELVGAGESEWGELAIVQARAVDPRSTTWELDAPVFRVAFFRHDPAYADVPPESVGYESEEWELTGGDVHDALAWAAEHAGPDRTWTLHVAGPTSDRPGLIWLAGIDPNAANAPTTTWRFTVPDDGAGEPSAG